MTFLIVFPSIPLIPQRAAPWGRPWAPLGALRSPWRPHGNPPFPPNGEDVPFRKIPQGSFRAIGHRTVENTHWVESTWLDFFLWHFLGRSLGSPRGPPKSHFPQNGGGASQIPFPCCVYWIPFTDLDVFPSGGVGYPKDILGYPRNIRESENI